MQYKQQLLITTIMNEKGKSVMMKMYWNELRHQGSFDCGLRDLFYLADNSNRKKLIQAFPNFFGTDTAEYFGINI